MNKQEPFRDDILRKYINPEVIEKAPEGFTSKTMTRIRIETESSKKPVWSQVKNPVPLISSLFTAVLIASVFLIPKGTSGLVGGAIIKYIRSFEITIPQLRLFSFPDLNLPGWFLYAIIGIVFLSFVDRALFGLFHRQRK